MIKYIMSHVQSAAELFGKFLPAGAEGDIVDELRDCGMEVGYEECDTIQLFEGSFYQAGDTARCRGKPLLVYVHSSGHPDAAPFVKHTLAASITVDIIKDCFVFWAATANSIAGHTCANSVVGTRYPLAAVLYPHKAGTGIVVLKIQGLIDSSEMCRRLSEALETCRNVTEAQRTNAQGVADRERLRTEQRRELEEAIASDILRQQLRNAEQQLRNTEEERVRNLQITRNATRDLLPVEPPPGPDVSTLKITLPSGQSIQRRYLRTNYLQVVYDTVVARDDYTGYEFYISTTFPVRMLSPRSTLQECELFPRAAVIVHEVEQT